MSYCTNCGVELEDDLLSCPLCGLKVGKNPTPESGNQSEFFPSDIIQLHKEESSKRLWELSGIIAFSGITVCTIVDLVLHKGLSWSLFADTSILAVWICITLILLAFKKYFIMVPGLLITILAMLLLFNLFSPPVNWFFGIALPVTIALFISVSIIIVLWKVANFRGFNILAIAFLVLSGFCIVTEVFIDKYTSDKVDIRWSAIVAVSILPIALVLLFVHYRMKKGKRLDSYFHV
jgi:Family of unknown function (DUF6320)